MWSALRAVSRGVPVLGRDDDADRLACPRRAYRRSGADPAAHQPERIPGGRRRGRPVGVLGRSDIIRALKTLGPDARVARGDECDAADHRKRRPLEEALTLLQDKSAPAVAVVDPDGRLVGLVTAETLGELMMVREAMPEGVRAGPWSRPAGA